MKITLLTVGKTEMSFVKQGLETFAKRIGHYAKFSIQEIVLPKQKGKIPPHLQQEKEAQLILKQIPARAQIILLDENGLAMTSREFASFLQNKMNRSTKDLIFVVGGPFGFHPDLRKQAQEIISLSRMTFSHQLIRLIFAELLYRAFTILNNEPYHNE